MSVQLYIIVVRCDMGGRLVLMFVGSSIVPHCPSFVPPPPPPEVFSEGSFGKRAVFFSGLHSHVFSDLPHLPPHGTLFRDTFTRTREDALILEVGTRQQTQSYIQKCS